MNDQPLYIIKVGGNIIDHDEKLNTFLRAFAALKGRKILVHGGGKLATKLAKDLSIPQQMIDGRRVTDAETLKIVTMVYAGLINKQIVARLNALGSKSVGLSGADATVISAHKRNHPTINYGYVGDVDHVDAGFLLSLIEQDLNVIIAPITQDDAGQLLNTNADTIAQEVAKATAALTPSILIYSFEKQGVLLDVNDEHSVIPSIDTEKFEQLKRENAIFEGMIPKLENALQAVRSGVKKVIIGDAMSLECLVEGKSGTTIH